MPWALCCAPSSEQFLRCGSATCPAVHSYHDGSFWSDVRWYVSKKHPLGFQGTKFLSSCDNVE